jgi:hypothetical protein
VQLCAVYRLTAADTANVAASAHGWPDPFRAVAHEAVRGSVGTVRYNQIWAVTLARPRPDTHAARPSPERRS